MPPSLKPLIAKAFTLIELLIVISIIGVLMALLFPAVNSALNGARRASALNDVTQIATAVTAYEADTGSFPPITANPTVVGGDLLNALMATTTNHNRRLIRFLEAPDYKANRGGVTNAGGSTAAYLDPWGGTYQININTTYDPRELLDVGGDNGPPAESIRRNVGVWNTNSETRLRVGSW